MLKISVIGDSGTGKSHLCANLSKTLELPVYDLEDIDWKHKFTLKRNPSERSVLLKQLQTVHFGIFAGVPSGWNDDFFSHADRIIVLHERPLIRAYRLFKRNIARRKNNLPAENFLHLSLNMYHALFQPSPTISFIRSLSPRQRKRVIRLAL